jgi:hypothetical protein
VLSIHFLLTLSTSVDFTSVHYTRFCSYGNMRFTQFWGAGLLVLASTATAVDLDPESEDSIRAATKQYATGMMALYKGGAEGVPKEDIGIWGKPYYWWEGGAAWAVSDGVCFGLGLY